jgi:hypothetical protein
MKKRFSEEQIVSFLREAERGVAVRDLCRRHGLLGSQLLPLAQQVRRHGGLSRWVTAQTHGRKQMALTRYVVAGVLTLGSAVISLPTAHAGKPDWIFPDDEGGLIGFGVVEVTPKKEGTGKYVASAFRFTYDVDAVHASESLGGQVAVMPCRAMRDKNNMSEKDLIAYMRAERGIPGGPFHMEIPVVVSEPTLLCVIYGPWKGMLMFDASPIETYKISATAEDGASYRWIDHDAGDVVIFNYGSVPELGKQGVLIRVYLLRSKKQLLDKSAYRIVPFELNPEARKRVDQIEALW